MMYSWLLYFFYREDTVALGTFKQKYRGDTAILLSETEDILARCRKLVPSLKDAEMDHEWLALRPSRDEMRVAKEVMIFDNTTLKVFWSSSALLFGKEHLQHRDQIWFQ